MDGLPLLLANHRFSELFRDELGWDRSSGIVAIDVDDRRLQFEAIAQKRGFQVLHCSADRRVLFNRGLLRRAQNLVSRTYQKHILIYSCSNPPKQVWQWAVRLPDGRKMRRREHPFFSSFPPDSLLSLLNRLHIDRGDGEDITIIDALLRYQESLGASSQLDLFAKRPMFAELSDQLAVAMRRGDEEAFHAFILLHRPLARHHSRRLWRAFGMDPEDAEQIAIIGLIKAARRFDPERGIQFSTYATHWVRQVCQSLGPYSALFIRLPAHVIGSYLPIHRRIKKLESDYGSRRAKDELELRCEEDPQFYRMWLMLERVLHVKSLSDKNETEYEDARSLLDSDEYEPIEQVMNQEFGERIHAAMSRLNKRESRFLRLHYGMDGDSLTLAEIGRREGLTRERVRQIQASAEKKLRKHIEQEFKDLLPSRVVDTEKSDEEP